MQKRKTVLFSLIPVRSTSTLDSNRMDMADAIVRELESEQYLTPPGWIFAMNNGFMRLVLLLSRASHGNRTPETARRIHFRKKQVILFS